MGSLRLSNQLSGTSSARQLAVTCPVTLRNPDALKSSNRKKPGASHTKFESNTDHNGVMHQMNIKNQSRIGERYNSTGCELGVPAHDEQNTQNSSFDPRACFPTDITADIFNTKLCSSSQNVHVANDRCIIICDTHESNQFHSKGGSHRHMANNYDSIIHKVSDSQCISHDGLTDKQVLPEERCVNSTAEDCADPKELLSGDFKHGQKVPERHKNNNNNNGSRGTDVTFFRNKEDKNKGCDIQGIDRKTGNKHLHQRDVHQKCRSRGSYYHYSTMDRLLIGKHAAEFGVASAVCWFKNKYTHLSESTVHSFRERYFKSKQDHRTAKPIASGNISLPLVGSSVAFTDCLGSTTHLKSTLDKNCMADFRSKTCCKSTDSQACFTSSSDQRSCKCSPHVTFLHSEKKTSVIDKRTCACATLISAENAHEFLPSKQKEQEYLDVPGAAAGVSYNLQNLEPSVENSKRDPESNANSLKKAVQSQRNVKKALKSDNVKNIAKNFQKNDKFIKYRKYQFYTNAERIEIGQHAVDFGVSAALKKYRSRFKQLAVSTVTNFRNRVLQKMQQTREHHRPEISFSFRDQLQPKQPDLKLRDCSVSLLILQPNHLDQFKPVFASSISSDGQGKSDTKLTPSVDNKSDTISPVKLSNGTAVNLSTNDSLVQQADHSSNYTPHRLHSCPPSTNPSTTSVVSQAKESSPRLDSSIKSESHVLHNTAIWQIATEKSIVAKSTSRVHTPRTRQTKRVYATYTDQDRVDIGKYALQYGYSATIERFSSKFPNLSESTVQHFKKKYLMMLHSVASVDSCSSDVPAVKPLVRKKGRPPKHCNIFSQQAIYRAVSTTESSASKRACELHQPVVADASNKHDEAISPSSIGLKDTVQFRHYESRCASGTAYDMSQTSCQLQDRQNSSSDFVEFAAPTQSANISQAYKPTKRYTSYKDEDRFEIAKFALCHGISLTLCTYKPQFPNLADSTIRHFKKKFFQRHYKDQYLQFIKTLPEDDAEQESHLVEWFELKVAECTSELQFSDGSFILNSVKEIGRNLIESLNPSLLNNKKWFVHIQDWAAKNCKVHEIAEYLSSTSKKSQHFSPIDGRSYQHSDHSIEKRTWIKNGKSGFTELQMPEAINEAFAPNFQTLDTFDCGMSGTAKKIDVSGTMKQLGTKVCSGSNIPPHTTLAEHTLAAVMKDCVTPSELELAKAKSDQSITVEGYDDCFA